MGQFRTGALTLGPIGSGVTPRRCGAAAIPTHRIHHRLGCGALSNARCFEAKDLDDHLEGNHERAA
jgi:hypothetical protein